MRFVSPHDVSIPDQDILSFLFSSPTLFSEHDSVWINAKNTSQCVTLAQARLLTRTIGYGLRSLGIGARGAGKDIVLSYVENQVMVAPTLFGVLCAGGIHSTCPVTATASELSRQIRLSQPRILICSSRTRNIAQEAIRSASIDGQVTLLIMESETLDIKLVGGRSLISAQELEWEMIFDRMMLKEIPALILFSSGTTGTPKGVELTHRNVVSNICQMRWIFDPVAKQAKRDGKHLRMPGIIQNAAPAGILVHSMMAMQTGLQVFLVEQYDFANLLDMIRDHEISALFLVPAIYSRVVQESNKESLQHIRFALSGASPLSADLQRRVSQMLPDGVSLKVNWGMTETSCAATQFELSETDEEGSVGRLLPKMQMIIVSPDGQRLAAGQLGEIRIKGPNIMRKYFENTEATKQSFDEDGWFKTGDIGTVAPSGKVFIKGRSKELLKYKGHQISPPELEGILAQCPDVVDAGVIGITSNNGDDLPRAYIVRKPGSQCTEKDVIEFFNSRVSRYKQLRGGIVFTREIPRNSNGKIMRSELKLLADNAAQRKQQSKL